MRARRLSWLLLLAGCASPRTDWQRPAWVIVSDLDREALRLDDRGRPVGELADLLRAVAERGDRVLVWRRTDPARALELLESGRADLACYDAAVLRAWGERVDTLPPPFDRLELRVRPSTAGAREDLVEDLRACWPGDLPEPQG